MQQGPAKKQTKLIFEESNPNCQSGFNKFIGQESTLFGAETHPSKTGENNDIGKANYAIMIFDKKVNGFRIVPVQRHFLFEKQRQF